MRLLYINPNSTTSMTESAVAVAQAALPEAEVLGWTNASGPPAIQGLQDGQAAVGGVMAMLPAARDIGADAIVIACFDDTGLAEIRAAAHCPVFGIGQSAFQMASLLGKRFEVLTSLVISVPVIENNIRASGFAVYCLGVHASGLAVLEIEAGGVDVESRLVAHIAQVAERGLDAVVLGCCAMAPLRARIAGRASITVIDGIEASAILAAAGHRWRHL